MQEPWRRGRVDADEGLAFAACELAVGEAITRAREFGITVAGVTNSHHCGVVVDHLRAVAAAGHGRPWICEFTVGDAGRRRQAPDLRHQSDGCSIPTARRHAVMIDLSLTEVARGKLMVAAKNGEHSGRLGPRCAGPADDRCEGRPRRVDAADGRGFEPQGRDAGACGRAAGHGADRRKFRLRGFELLRRRGQPAAHRPGLHRRRPRCIGSARHITSTASSCWWPRCSRTKACACPARGARPCSSKSQTDGLNIGDALLKCLQTSP